MNKIGSFISAAFLLIGFASACQLTPETSTPTGTPASLAETPTRIPPAYTFHPTITRWPATRVPSVTPRPFYTATSTPTVTLTSTQVPPGVFALDWYKPLTLHFDVGQWIDYTGYGGPGQWSNHFLESVNLSTCEIFEQGPTDFNGPHLYETVSAGAIDYGIILFPGEAGNETSGYYMVENESVAGFDYTVGTPVLVVNAMPDQWSECRSLAEDVLATLSMP